MRLIKKIDLYILRRYFTTFFFVFAMFMLIAVVIDISERLEDFTRPNHNGEYPTVLEVIRDYYFNFIPYMGAILAPVFLFISVIFFTTKMTYNKEIVAMASSGVSIYRILVPYMVGASFLCVGLYFANNWLVPDANKGRLAFEFEHVRSAKHYTTNIIREPEPGIIVYLVNFNHRNNRGGAISIDFIENGELKRKIRADNANFLPGSGRWQLKNFKSRTFYGEEEVYDFQAVKDTTLPITPDDFEPHTDTKDKMDMQELKQFIAEESKKGTENLAFYKVEGHRRSASAFSMIILTLIGAVMGTRREKKGGVGLNLAMGVGLSAALIFFSQFSTTFSTKGNLHPFLGAWIPNFVFGIIALILLRFSPK